MIKKGILSALFALLFAGCSMINTPDQEGWKPSQKEAFLSVLKNDRYLSICDQKALYKKVMQTENSRLMTRLLIAYTGNLANSCIDLNAFKHAQSVRKTDDFETDYAIYRQKVDPQTIKRELKAGMSIAQILHPYVPQYREFDRLVNVYRKIAHDTHISAKKRYKVRLNIERIKLMKPEVGKTYALVNIPEFRVHIIEGNKTALTMKVIVGKRNKQTPVFSQDLKYIVLNPQWNVPDSIVRKEMIPKILKNPNYLKQHHIVIRRDYSLESPKLSLDQLNLKSYVDSKAPLPFKFIQVPSKRNGLGRVKFLFPNKYAVYMHDTQSKYLFRQGNRCYSHGCIRLERPKAMLTHLIGHYTATSAKKGWQMYDSLETHFIPLMRRLPVHTAYLTAYVNDNGTLHLFSDIYGYDKIQRLKFRL